MLIDDPSHVEVNHTELRTTSHGFPLHIYTYIIYVYIQVVVVTCESSQVVVQNDRSFTVF